MTEICYETRRTCRLCAADALDTVLHLGDLAFSAFPEPGELAEIPRAPLDFCQCRACSLVQLRQTVDPALLYRQYWYRSSINEAMQAELTAIVSRALTFVSLYADDLVIDVGANDGYLLSRYAQLGRFPTRIAYEPAVNLQDECQRHATILLSTFFPGPSDDRWIGKVKILTSIAMFYDLDNPYPFVEEVDRLLHPDGVWIVQFQDLGQMVDQTAFDNCCHEHLTYWSLAAFERLLARSGTDLHIVEVETRAINGGSLRLAIRRKAHPVGASVEHHLLMERLSTDWQALERFAWRASTAAAQIRGMVSETQRRGLTIDLYGASTKANTLLQYCGLGPRSIRQAWERNPEKIGRSTATGIPIVGEAVGREEPPDVLLVGIWQFRELILKREAEYLAGGGRLLFPLPEVDLVAAAAIPAGRRP